MGLLLELIGERLTGECGRGRVIGLQKSRADGDANDAAAIDEFDRRHCSTMNCAAVVRSHLNWRRSHWMSITLVLRAVFEN
jgi:hypothetical protein